MSKLYKDIFTPLINGVITGKTFLSMVEKRVITILLEDLCYNKSKVAKSLGVTRPTLNKLLKKHQLER